MSLKTAKQTVTHLDSWNIKYRGFIAVRSQETVDRTIQVNKNNCDEICRCTHLFSTSSPMTRKDRGESTKPAPFLGVRYMIFCSASPFNLHLRVERMPSWKYFPTYIFLYLMDVVKTVINDQYKQHNGIKNISKKYLEALLF